MSPSFISASIIKHQELKRRLPMEKGGGGDDSARAVGMCDRFLTFLAKNLTMNRQKSITEGPRNGGIRNNAEKEDEEDEFVIRIEKAEFELSQEEDHRNIEATILEDGHAAVNTARAAADEQKQKEKKEEEANDHQGDVKAEAAVAAVEKVKRSVTIKDEREAAATGGEKNAAAKKTLSKKRSSAASSSSQLGAGGDGPNPAPAPAPRRAGLRPRMPAILRVPTNINERSTTFIEERKKNFGRSKTEKK